MANRDTAKKIIHHYNYLEPTDSRKFLFGDQVISDLVYSNAFRRLKKIRFLGGIDYAIVRSPNGSRSRYTRYQHSIGVAYLANIYAQSTCASYNDRRTICVAALLHDIGHAPLSHSLEKVFIEHFGINHHIATEKIITGQVEIGREILEILKWNKINIEEVLAIINGERNFFDGFFSGPINFDTIEGILRSYVYAKRSPTTPKPNVVTLAAIERSGNIDKQIVDTFWNYKNLVYNTIITSRKGILADQICQIIMKNNIELFSENDYYTDENILFDKIPELRRILRAKNFDKAVENYIVYPVKFNRRKFYIDENHEFYDRNDTLRYKQTKSSDILLPRQNMSKPYLFEGDLFDAGPD